jgi:hypothetical protein
MILPLSILLISALPSFCFGDFIPQAKKTSSTFYGPEKRAIARANAAKYEWAEQKIARAV